MGSGSGLPRPTWHSIYEELRRVQTLHRFPGPGDRRRGVSVRPALASGTTNYAYYELVNTRPTTVTDLIVTNVVPPNSISPPDPSTSPLTILSGSFGFDQKNLQVFLSPADPTSQGLALNFANGGLAAGGTLDFKLSLDPSVSASTSPAAPAPVPRPGPRADQHARAEPAGHPRDVTTPTTTTTPRVTPTDTTAFGARAGLAGPLVRPGRRRPGPRPSLPPGPAGAASA